MERKTQKIILTKEAQKDYDKLDKFYQKIIDREYSKIEIQGSTKGLYIKHIKEQVFEIKTGDLRSLFAFENGDLIVIAVIFIKKSQKTPVHLVEKAIRLLKKRENENE